MSLYVTELRRLFKRRLTRLLLVLMVLGLAGIATTLAFSSQQHSPAAVAAAEAKAERQYLDQVKWHEQSVAECEAAKARGEDVEERWGPDCGREWAPQREQIEAEWFLPYQFDFREETGSFFMIFAGVVALFAFIVAASFIGAEWHSGGMMNLLLWRPKRLTVLLTKLAAVLSAVFAIGTVLAALWTAALWFIAKYRGSTAKVTAGVWESTALTGLRVIGLVLAVVVVSFGLASIGRHTAMALGAAVGLFAISEVGLRIALAAAAVRFGDRYVLSTYALAWFEKQWTLVDDRSCNFTRGQCVPQELIITWQDSAVVFGVGTALVFVVALWQMRRRNIT